jgi:parallel beta-helix repeat protein
MAQARKLNVHPGKKAIPRAIKRAHSGDKLRIHKGRYRGGFEVTKRLKLVGVGKTPPVIDGRCKTNRTLTVAHGRVVLDGLEVVGADGSAGEFSSEVFYQGIRSGRAEDLLLEDTCDAEYGINVFASGHLKLTGNAAEGFSDAGFYIGGITDTQGKPLLVQNSAAQGNNRGVIVEDSAGGDVRIEHNALQNNTAPGENAPSGIFLTNSDGVLIEENALQNNGIGIHLNPTSDANRLIMNAAQGQAPDLLNEGAGNCGSGNAFVTTAGLPLAVC